MPRALALLALLALLASLAVFALPTPDPARGQAMTQPPPPGLGDWRFDVLVLKNGSKFQGLILADLPDRVEFRSVTRLPGRPTVTLTGTFSKAEIAEIKPLSDKEREALREKLADLDPSGEGERKRMDSLELVPADWPDRPGAAKL
ncbi:MAG: hypothetical protein K2V38_23625, partial [Gemmataceae bacterium]|nr:hypothetical protein [Gemmataceae bacterium]